MADAGRGVLLARWSVDDALNAGLWITHSRGSPGFEDGFELVAPEGTSAARISDGPA